MVAPGRDTVNAMRTMVALVAVAALCTACTTNDPKTPPSLTKGSGLPSEPTSTPSEGVAPDPIRLGCDAAGVTKTASQHVSHGVLVGGQTLGDLEGPTSVPRATSVGLQPPSTKQDWYFIKAPLTVQAGAGPITLKVRSHSAQRLSWVSSEVWTSGTAPNLADWATTEVTFEGCPDRNVTYLGGLLTRKANGCALIQVDTPHARQSAYTWAFGSSTTCPSQTTSALHQ